MHTRCKRKSPIIWVAKNYKHRFSHKTHEKKRRFTSAFFPFGNVDVCFEKNKTTAHKDGRWARWSPKKCAVILKMSCKLRVSTFLLYFINDQYLLACACVCLFVYIFFCKWEKCVHKLIPDDQCRKHKNPLCLALKVSKLHGRKTNDRKSTNYDGNVLRVHFHYTKIVYTFHMLFFNLRKSNKCVWITEYQEFCVCCCYYYRWKFNSLLFCWILFAQEIWLYHFNC